MENILIYCCISPGQGHLIVEPLANGSVRLCTSRIGVNCGPDVYLSHDKISILIEKLQAHMGQQVPATISAVRKGFAAIDNRTQALKIRDLAAALNATFTWSRTEEQALFWGTIYERLDSMGKDWIEADDKAKAPTRAQVQAQTSPFQFGEWVSYKSNSRHDAPVYYGIVTSLKPDHDGDLKIHMLPEGSIIYTKPANLTKLPPRTFVPGMSVVNVSDTATSISIGDIFTLTGVTGSGDDAMLQFNDTAGTQRQRRASNYCRA